MVGDISRAIAISWQSMNNIENPLVFNHKECELVNCHKDDKNEINKLLHGMTAQQKQDLLKRRENVLRLVNGE